MSRSWSALVVAIGVGAVVAAATLLVKGKQPTAAPALPPVEAAPATANESAARAERGPRPPRLPAARPTRAVEVGDDTRAGDAANMTTLRRLKASNPLVSLELARAGNERFPNSPDAPERAWFEARALVDLQRFAEAQRVARGMVERYPEATWTADLRRHLLANPLGLPPRPR